MIKKLGIRIGADYFEFEDADGTPFAELKPLLTLWFDIRDRLQQLDVDTVTAELRADNDRLRDEVARRTPPVT